MTIQNDSLIEVTCFQLNSQEKLQDNLKHIWQMADQAFKQSQDNHQEIKNRLMHRLWVLPENAFCFAGHLIETSANISLIQQQMAKLAQTYGVWLVAGTVPCATRPNGEAIEGLKVRSACLAFNPEGEQVARYDKIHLFEAIVADGVGRYQESDQFEAGNELCLISTPLGKIGLLICFDVRFPEQALNLRRQGADIICVPSAFTYQTGEKHWELLLRARAIDTHCFIVGCNQTGWHAQHTRQTFGHSMVVAPTGKIMAQLHENSTCLQIVIDTSLLQQVRNTMPLVGVQP